LVARGLLWKTGCPPIGGAREGAEGLVKKTIYAITLVLLLGALIVQSVWGATHLP
jgi:hypothetical protein